jgi:predicted kinase
MTEKTYKKMARTAEQMIAQGKSAILDASFVRRAQREKVVRLAGKHKIPLLVIHCSASERTTQERLAQRQAQGLDVSDGRWDVYLEQKKACEPLDEIPLAARLELNTDASLDQLTSDSEKFLRRRLICQPR